MSRLKKFVWFFFLSTFILFALIELLTSDFSKNHGQNFRYENNQIDNTNACISAGIGPISLSCRPEILNNNLKQTKNINNSLFINAELQYENENQKKNIVTALNDIIFLSIDELKTKKYPNYSGIEHQWDLPTLLSKFFVFNKEQLQKLDPLIFYSEIKNKSVQEEVKQKLVNIYDLDEDVIHLIGLWKMDFYNNKNMDTLKINISEGDINLKILNVEKNPAFATPYFENNTLYYNIIRNDTTYSYVYKLSKNKKILTGGKPGSWEKKAEKKEIIKIK